MQGSPTSTISRRNFSPKANAHARGNPTASFASWRVNAYPPSKNRVWDFFGETHSRTSVSWSQVVEPHREINPDATTTAQDVEYTALYYYGYRFYDPELGRWSNRDPIGETGGVNLTVLLRNYPIGSTDKLGMSPADGTVSCRDFKRDKLGGYLQGFPVLKEKWEHMKSECGFSGHVKTKCSCRGGCKDPLTGGSYKSGRTLVLCSNKDRTLDDWGNIWRHEFSHMFDVTCGASFGCEPGSGAFKQRICSEMRAYSTDASIPREKLYNRALNSVAASCCKRDCEPDVGSGWWKVYNAAQIDAAAIWERCADLKPLDPIPVFPPVTH